MEKVIYILSKEAATAGDDFRDLLINNLSPAIDDFVKSVQINVVDGAVAATSMGRAGPEAAQKLPEPPVADGMLSIWVRSVSLLDRVEDSLREFTQSFHGYLVTESEPLPIDVRATSPVSRTAGFDQVAFLRKPSGQDYSDWIYKWQGLHTQVAIDTQSTSRYIQNVIVRPLTPGAPDIHGIVEEGYPDEAAMYDPMVFYDAVGDKDRMDRNIRLMMESCSRFIDFDAQPCDMIGMSQYIVKNRPG